MYIFVTDCIYPVQEVRVLLRSWKLARTIICRIFCRASGICCMLFCYFFQIEKKWEIPRSYLTLEDVIGEGEFGKVLSARLLQKDVACGKKYISAFFPLNFWLGFSISMDSLTHVTNYRNSQKHESTLLHTYVLKEFLTADRLKKTLIKVGSSNLYASVGTFCVQIGHF